MNKPLPLFSQRGRLLLARRALAPRPSGLAGGALALLLTLGLSGPLAAQPQPKKPAHKRAAPTVTAPTPASAPAAAPTVDVAPAAAVASAAPQGDYIVAIVNDEPVTNLEVRTRLLRAEQALARDKTPLPSRAVLGPQALEQVIAERAQLQVARDLRLNVSEAQVDQAVQTVAQQNQTSVAELLQRAAADGISQRQLRESLRNQIILSRLREREVEPRVRVSEQDIDQFLQQQSARAIAAGGGDVNLSQVLVVVPENASDSEVARLQQRAQRAADRAHAGEDFAALAREMSDAPNARATGGAMGLRPADRYPQLFVSATRDLPAGGIAGPVRSAAGFHVLKVLERSAGSSGGLSVMQTHARHILLRPGPSLSEAAASARLADFKRRIDAGQADFAKLAREHSQDGSAAQGGDLGWAMPGQFVPEFENVLSALTPGQISPPIVSRFGVHLIELIERRQATLSPREQRELARNVLREKKYEEAFNLWAQEVRGRAYVEYRQPPTF